MKKTEIQEGLDFLIENFDVPPDVISEIKNSYRKVYGDSDGFFRGLLTKYMSRLNNRNGNGKSYGQNEKNEKNK